MFFYQFCYRIFFWLKRRKRSKKFLFLKKPFTELSDLFSYYFSLLLNRKYPAFFESHPVKCGINRKPRGGERYVVSLTSFPARINYAHLAIETLMRQSFKADAIVLWLTREEFPSEDALPASLRRLKDKGLTIRFCDNLRSHKKYYHTFKEYADCNVIVVDDDMFYPLDLIERLVGLHRKYPESIICESAQIIHPKITSLPSEWVVAENNADYSGSMYVQPFTGYGTLYPPHWYPEEVFNVENIKKYAFTADDLWLKAMSIINNVKSVKERKFRAFYVEIDIKNNKTLFSVNKSDGENLNDITWKSLCEKYDLGKYVQ